MIRAPLAQRFALGLSALSLRLRLRGLVEQSSLPALLDALSRGDIEPASRDDVEEALARADTLTAALPFVPQTCLYRSLARYALLRRAGHAPRFVMAVEPPRDAHGEIEGHAWVEIDGVPFGEEVDERLVVTYAYQPVESSSERPGAREAEARNPTRISSEADRRSGARSR